MKKIELQKKITEGLSTRKIAEKFELSQSTINYWLKKYKLKTKPKLGRPTWPNGKHLCKYCGVKNKNRFYQKSKMICKTCQNKKRSLQFVEKKKKAVVFYGGECIRCGYSKYYGALEFHHRDPKNKVLNPVKIINRTNWEKAKIELDKCDLVCSNCHREIHALG